MPRGNLTNNFIFGPRGVSTGRLTRDQKIINAIRENNLDPAYKELSLLTKHQFTSLSHANERWLSELIDHISTKEIANYKESIEEINTNLNLHLDISKTLLEMSDRVFQTLTTSFKRPFQNNDDYQNFTRSDWETIIQPDLDPALLRPLVANALSDEIFLVQKMRGNLFHSIESRFEDMDEVLNKNASKFSVVPSWNTIRDKNDYWKNFFNLVLEDKDALASTSLAETLKVAVKGFLENYQA